MTDTSRSTDRSELDRLMAEERLLSRRRTALHDRMNFVGSGDPTLEGLRDQESELSAERRAVQERIDALRSGTTSPNV